MLLRQWMQGWSAGIPSQCEVCRAWPSQPLCEACTQRFAGPRHRCRRCALAVPQGVDLCGRCLRDPPPLDACHAAVSYGYPWSGIISGFKFGGRPGWARPLSRLLQALPALPPELQGARFVIPMPLSAARLAQRGFNQAHELARRLAPGRVDAGLVLRLQDTPPQVSLDRQSRQANVRSAFAVEPARTGEVRGQSVLLVDDVMTSGASLHALARVLRQAGAARVSAVVLARTED